MNYPTTFEMTTTDSLTNLLNGTYFRHLLREQLLPKAQADLEPLSLFMFDIDNMYLINQTHGLKCGDAVLRGVGQTLKETLPETVVAARYSGDEFCVALPDTRLDDAFTIAEELRRRIAALSFAEWPEVHISCSIGLAGFPGNGSTDVNLFHEADQALYTAKMTGRNKVALPLTDSRMVTKTSHYTQTHLERLSQLAKTLKRNEASLLREALDDLLKKYSDLHRQI